LAEKSLPREVKMKLENLLRKIDSLETPDEQKILLFEGSED